MIKRNAKGQFIKGNTIKLGTKHTKEAKRKMSLAKKGKKLLEAHKRKIAESMKGKNANEKNPMWKGKKVGYMGLHNWVRRNLGTPIKCNRCGKEFRGRNTIHWANLSGKYLRDLKDWERLCSSCHKKLDLQRAK